MDFGVVLQTNPPARRVVELARRAEANGFTHVWVFDSHVLWQEPFVILARILAETERIVVGPMVTNPGSRDWTVLASTFATLNDAYGPRTICGIGRGDSALRVIGRKPRTLAEMAQAMRIIKGLVAGETVDYHGTELGFPWVEQGWDLPMWGAGYGPRALDTIGRHADGFVLQLADPQILEWTRSAVMEAAARQGRAPGSVATAVVAPAYVGDDIAHQREQLRWFGGMVGNHVADLVKRYGEDASSVPRVLSDYIKDRADYDYSHHGRAGNPSTDFVPDSIVDRFCVLGRVEDHIAKLTTLRDMGTDHFAIYPHARCGGGDPRCLRAIGPCRCSPGRRRPGRRILRRQWQRRDRNRHTERSVRRAARHQATQRRPACAEGSATRRVARPSGDGHAGGDWQSAAGADYERKGFSSRSGYGTRPRAPDRRFHQRLHRSGHRTRRRLRRGARRDGDACSTSSGPARLPVCFTTVAYEPHLRDGGQFVAKVPALSILVKGSEWVKVDERISPRPLRAGGAEEVTRARSSTRGWRLSSRAWASTPWS